MKRIKGVFITLFLTTVMITVVAQNDQNALRDVVERNTYGDNWFVSVGGNANLLLAEQDQYAPLMDRLAYGGAFTLGKWFNPNLGARIQLMGGGLKGINNSTYFDGNGAYYVNHNFGHTHEHFPIGGDPLDPANYSKYKYFQQGSDEYWGFWQNFNYASATLDLMLNFTNLMRGHYKEHSPVDFIPFFGLGVIHAFDNGVTTPNYNHVVAKIGVRINVNVTDNLAVYIEPQANATEREFDGYAGTAIGDAVANLGLGLQYTFNKKFTTLSQIVQLTADEIDRLNKKINDARYLIENQQDILERQQSLLDRLEKCCDEGNKKEVITQVVEFGGLPEYVRFSIDSYQVEPTEQRKLSDVAEYLRKHPDSKLLMIGYADRKTGNPRYNMKLSQRRIDAVTKELSRLGISPNRVISEWKGDVEQPFPQNEWNRVVVMVERK